MAFAAELAFWLSCSAAAVRAAVAHMPVLAGVRCCLWPSGVAAGGRGCRLGDARRHGVLTCLRSFFLDASWYCFFEVVGVLFYFLMACGLPRLRPAGVGGGGGGGDGGVVVAGGPGPGAHLPGVDGWFLCGSVLPFADCRDVPRRGGCWLELFCTFSQDFGCGFGRFATSCVVAPVGLEVGPRALLVCGHFGRGVGGRRAGGEAVGLGRWLCYFQIHLGINNYNFLIKVRQLVSQHCVDNRIWLRWRSDLSDY